MPKTSARSTARRLRDRELQLTDLAQFIIENVPGEPSESEGAVDCAKRIITNLQGNLAATTEDCANLTAMAETIAGRAALAVRQGLYVKDLFARLAQRYAGVQLDVQRMTIGQADEFVKRELGAMEQGLAEVAVQVEAEQVQLAQFGQGEAVAMEPSR